MVLYPYLYENVRSHFFVMNWEGTMNEDRLLKLPEVAARLALSRTAIYQMIARGELKPVRIGGAIRFQASAIDRVIHQTQEAINADA